MEKSTVSWADYVWRPLVGWAPVIGVGEVPGPHGTCVGIIKSRIWQPLDVVEPSVMLVSPECDLFDERVPQEWIDAIVTAMMVSSRHRFVVLTRCVNRMAEYLCSAKTTVRLMSNAMNIAKYLSENGINFVAQAEFIDDGLDGFQLPNVVVGVSGTTHNDVSERLLTLSRVPAWMRCVCLDPLQWAVDLSRWLAVRYVSSPRKWERNGDRNLLDWVIVSVRANDDREVAGACEQWIKDLRDQCVEAGVPFYLENAALDGLAWKQKPDLLGSDFIRHTVPRRSVGGVA